MTNPLHSATLNVERKYIMSIDQGTTSSRAILFDKAGKIVLWVSLSTSRFPQGRLG